MQRFRIILPVLIPVIIFSSLYIFLMKEKTETDFEIQLAPKSEFYNKKFGYKSAYLKQDVTKEGDILNIRINGTPGTSEPLIVSNKFNTLFTFCNNYQNHSAGTMFESEDGGLNWKEIDIPLSESNKNVFYADPYAATDEEGNVYYTAIEMDNSSIYKVIYNKYDIDSKKWFEKSVVIEENNNGEIKFDKPKVLFVNNHLYLSYVKKDDGERLWLAKINKDGKFEKTQITDEETHSASLVNDKSGNLYCIYLKERTELYIKYSKDGGNSWSDKKLVAEFEMPGRRINKQPVIKFGNNLGIRINSDPQVVVHNDEIYVVYCAKGVKDDSDIYFTRANINTLDFSAPVIPHFNTANTDHFLPSLSVDNSGNIFITYQDSRDDNLNVFVNTYCSYSDNNGLSFKDIKLSTKSFNAYDIVINGIYLGDYNSSVISNGKLISAWTDGRNKNFDIYASIVSISDLK